MASANEQQRSESSQTGMTWRMWTYLGHETCIVESSVRREERSK